MRNASKPILVASLLAAIGFLLPTPDPANSAQDPGDDEVSLRRAMAERTFRENCLICHDAELTTSQRLTAAGWKAEMDKMLAWGAPVPPEEVESLTEWLIAEFPPDRPDEEPGRAPKAAESSTAVSRALVVRAGGDAMRGQELYRMHCAQCHGSDAQGGDLGPNLVERPGIVRDDLWNESVLVGRHRMPGYRHVLDEQEATDLRSWLLGRRYGGGGE